MQTITKITIPLNPVTKKNSQRIANCGNYRRVLQSKAYCKYERDCRQYVRAAAPREPISEPVEVTAQFYMQSRRIVDLTNLLAALDDILVKWGVLADDNYKIIISHDGSRVQYDKEHPRTECMIRLVSSAEIPKWIREKRAEEARNDKRGNSQRDD